MHPEVQAVYFVICVSKKKQNRDMKSVFIIPYTGVGSFQGANENVKIPAGCSGCLCTEKTALAGKSVHTETM